MIALEDPWTVAYLALHASLVLTVVAGTVWRRA